MQHHTAQLGRLLNGFAQHGRIEVVVAVKGDSLSLERQLGKRRPRRRLGAESGAVRENEEVSEGGSRLEIHLFLELFLFLESHRAGVRRGSRTACAALRRATGTR